MCICCVQRPTRFPPARSEGAGENVELCVVFGSRVKGVKLSTWHDSIKKLSFFFSFHSDEMKLKRTDLEKRKKKNTQLLQYTFGTHIP